VFLFLKERIIGKNDNAFRELRQTSLFYSFGFFINPYNWKVKELSCVLSNKKTALA